MPGPPPKPTALKVLHGSFKAHPERRNRREARPVGEVVAPEWLSTQARVLWDQMTPEMVRTGLLTPLDAPLLAEALEALVIARLARHRAVQEAMGRISTQPGGPSAAGTYARAIAIVISLGSRFGMTPADRSRIAVGGDYHPEGGDLLT